MKTFTDNTGRTWTLSVTVGTIKRVRALCSVDLANIITIEAGKAPNVGLLDRLASDPVLLVDVLYAVCKPLWWASLSRYEPYCFQTLSRRVYGSRGS